MRQRKVKNIEEKLASYSDILLDEPQDLQGQWHGAFGNSNPIYLELGCGKGQFITTYARKYPDRNYVGIEGQDCVILRALEKAAGDVTPEETRSEGFKLNFATEEDLDYRGLVAEPELEASGEVSFGGTLMTELTNVFFVCDFVQDIRDYFDYGELAGIYLNFSDPWPKARHAKRRLTYGGRLLSYMDVLAPGGVIEIKTDNDALFHFTMEEIKRVGLKIEAYSWDLHDCGGDADFAGAAEAAFNAEAAFDAEAADGEEALEVIDYEGLSNELARELLVKMADELGEDAAGVTTEYEDKFRSGGKTIHYVRIRKNAVVETASGDIEFFVM